MMMAGLLLLFEGKGPLSFPAAAVGYLSFLLTMVRTMWGSWLVGLLALVTSLKLKLQMRLVITNYLHDNLRVAIDDYGAILQND